MSGGGGAPSGVAVGTVVAKNYLPFARVLARSLAEHHPRVPFFVLLADEPGAAFDSAAEPFTMVGLHEVGIVDLRSFLFRYTRQQVIVAGKAFLLRWLLDQGFERAVFFDADILVLGDLAPLLAPEEPYPVLLTPHLLAPLVGPDRTARELQVLRSGVYNGGFVAVSDSPTARRFLAWWQERLYLHCRHAIGEGMHFDQRWLDLVPALFEGVGIVRDPGCNVAYWNLPEREVATENGPVRVAGQPVRFFHFSGFDPDEPATVTRYNRRLRMADVGAAAELFGRYTSLLLAAGWREAKSWPYAYGCFDDGTPIPEVARSLYADLGQEASAFGDPFRSDGESSVFQWLNQPIDGPSRSRRKITRLWHAVYRQRPDVQRAFPDLLGADRRRFLRWARNHGAREHGVPEALLPGASR